MLLYFNKAKNEKPLENYLSELLYEHDCVVIPKFGAFIANYQSAQIDSYFNRIFPPSKKIAFNPSLKTNDGLLGHYISKKENISFNEALDKIDHTVKIWENQLQQNKEIDLEDVGKLFINEDGKIIFKVNKKVNFLIDSFGFRSTDLQKVNRRKIILEMDNYQKQRQLHSQKVFNRNSNKKNKRILLYSVASYLPILAGIWFFFLTKEPFTEQNLSNINPFEQKSIVAESIQVENKTIVKENEKQLLEKKPIEEINKTETTESINTENQNIETQKSIAPLFYIIGGSFQNKNNAQEYQAILQNKNYDSEIITSNSSYFRVSYSKFKNNFKAIQYLNNIKKVENTSAWILKQ